MTRLRRLTLRAVVALAAAGAVGGAVACERSTAPAAATGTLPVFAQFNAATPVNVLVITVTGTGIATPLVFNLPIVNNTASGTLTLPIGPARNLLAQAFDNTGALLYSGSTTVTVGPGANTAAALILAPQAGTVPVTVSLGTYTVVITPAQAGFTVAAGATQQLGATVLDPTGTPVATTVRWASSVPTIAGVDATGLVTGVASGTATVGATALGASATVTITVP